MPTFALVIIPENHRFLTPLVQTGGVIESVGKDVTLNVGAHVYISGSVTGAYAEKALCLEADVHALPSTVTFPQGAAVNIPYATAYRALFQRAHATPGEVVLVHGASGGVGIAALQIARAAGLQVLGTAGSPKGMELVLHEGAHYALDHQAPDHFEKALALTDGRGVDVVLEMLANLNLGKDMKILAPGGRIVVVGSRGPTEIDPRDTMIRDAAILGMLLFNISERELKAIHCALFSGLENGVLRPVIGKELPLAEAPKAHEDILKSSAYGKIVLIP